MSCCRLSVMTGAASAPQHALGMQQANARRRARSRYTKSDENSSKSRWLLTTSQAAYGFIRLFTKYTKNKDKTKDESERAHLP